MNMPRWRRRTKIKVPFYDSGRPNPPYIKGSRWEIQEHDPPQPFGVGYKTMHERGPKALANMLQEQLPQSVYCMLNSPRGPEPPPNTARIQIEVVETLRVNASQGPQVVVCRIISSDRDGIERKLKKLGCQLVAKLYDPLYYHHDGKFDIIELADMEYSREAAAYEHLQEEGVDGQLLPAYFGSFTLEIPLEEQQREILDRYTQGRDRRGAGAKMRRVRLTMMEKIEEQPMTYQLVFGDLSVLPAETRLTAVATAMEAYAKLYFHGVVHGDLAPRNIFIDDKRQTGDGSRAAGGRLQFYRFIDLDLAYVLGRPDSAYPRRPAHETRPRNPIRLFWQVFESGAANMYYWLPPNLRNTREFHSWMLQRWYGDTRFEPLGAVPEPSADGTPWGTGAAAKDAKWTGDKTPEAGASRLGDVLSVATSKVLSMAATGKGEARETAAKGPIPLAKTPDKSERPEGFW